MVVPGALKLRAVPSALRKRVPFQLGVVRVRLPRALLMVPVKLEPSPERVRVPPSVWTSVPVPRMGPEALPVVTLPHVR